MRLQTSLLACALGVALGCDDAPSEQTDAAPADMATADMDMANMADSGDLGSPDMAGEDRWPTCPTPGPLDDTLSLAHVFSLGTHNSYHVRDEVVADPRHDYSHPLLGEQLDRGVRQLELDLHWHKERGLVVFHLPVLDDASVCDRWTDCLAELAAWSRAHPCHVPLVIWLELKDDELDRINPDYDTLAGRYDQIEAELAAVWPREHLLSPDDVRGAHPDLPTALAADGWPPLAQTRGRLLVTLLDGGDHRDAYLEGAPALQERLLFVRADDPGQPFAATFKLDDPVGDRARIQATVDAGFLVTSNVNGRGTPQAERQAELDTAVETAPHHLATDFLVPQDDSGYVTALPDGSPACHPRTAPAGCTAEAVEPR